MESQTGRVTRLLAVCFFLSGMCGLVYEILWLRILSLAFGNTTLATSTILASYMGGLGLGALYFGRKIDAKPVHPVRFYAKLELGVALYAFLTPLLWFLAENINIGFFRLFEPGYVVFSLFKFALAFVLLFLPTFLMGGTLPVVSAFLVKNRSETARYVGLLYALNTFGAVAGVLFSAFFALHTLGLWQTLYLTGAANLAIYFLLRKRDPDNQLWNADKNAAIPSEEKTAAAQDAAPPLSRGQLILLLSGFALSGAVSMIYEVGWTRVLAMVLGSSVYAFAIMLSTFLLGIAFGSWLFSLLARRRKMGWEAFAILEILTGLAVIAGINAFDDLPYWFVRFYKIFHADPLLMDVARFFLTAAVMFVPTLFIGAIFTAFLNCYRREPGISRDVGSAYFANTIGTIAGAATAGFFFIPAIGIQRSLVAGGVTNVAIGILVLLVLRPVNMKRAAAGMTVTVLLLALLLVRLEPWNATVLASDTAVKPDRVAGLSLAEFKDSFKAREILFYKEGMSATVSVARAKDNVSLAVNGKVDASNSDAFTQYMLGHLPMLLHPAPEDVLVIGLGSGSTAAAVASYPAKRIDVAELEEAVVEGSRFFNDLNRNVLLDPRVRLHVNDGRNILLVRPDKYDVIISEPSNPWMAGVANLFALEHFRTMKKRLKPGGVVCQWLHAYSMSVQDLAMIIRTFTTAFDHTQLWAAHFPDFMLIGYDEEPSINVADLERRFDAVPQARKDLSPYGIISGRHLLGSYWVSDAGLRELGHGAQINTDNRPLLEYSAPRHLYELSIDVNFRFVDAMRDRAFTGFISAPSPKDNAALLLDMAEAMVSKGWNVDARDYLERALVLDSSHPKIRLLTGIFAYHAQDYDTARSALETALPLLPDSSLAYYYAALSQGRAGNLDKAIEYLERAVALEPENTEWLKNYADVLFEKGRFDEAGKAYDRLITLKGRDFDALNRQVEIVLKSNNLPAQVLMLDKMIREYSQYAPAYLQLGSIYESAGNFDLARNMFEKFVELVPDREIGWLSLARIGDKTRDDKLLHDSIKKAVKINPELRSNPEIQKLLGS